MRNKNVIWLLLGIGVGVMIVMLAKSGPTPAVVQSTVEVKRPIHNKEVWTYTDVDGNEKKIEVERLVD